MVSLAVELVTNFHLFHHSFPFFPLLILLLSPVLFQTPPVFTLQPSTCRHDFSCQFCIDESQIDVFFQISVVPFICLMGVSTQMSYGFFKPNIFGNRLLPAPGPPIKTIKTNSFSPLPLFRQANKLEIMSCHFFCPTAGCGASSFIQHRLMRTKPSSFLEQLLESPNWFSSCKSPNSLCFIHLSPYHTLLFFMALATP